MELTEADAGGETAVGVGEDVVLRLEENRTTGYSWQLSVPDELAVLEDTFDIGTATAPGAAGVRTFRLRPAAPGVHRVAVALRRSWEAAPAAGTRLEFTVRAG